MSTGTSLLNGGPGSLVLGFVVVCTCVWGMLQTISELSIAFPVSRNFIEYADRFMDPALSFAAGLSMWLGWTAIVAAEATFFSVIVKHWAQNRVHDAVWCKYRASFFEQLVFEFLIIADTVFLVIMMITFMLASVWFGWFEYCAAILKIMALLIFVLAGFSMVLGAGPKGFVHHGDGWKEYPFKNGFKGFASPVLLAVLAIGGKGP